MIFFLPYGCLCLSATDPKLEVGIVDAPAAFGQSAGITNQTPELREPCHSLDPSIDSQQLFLPISQPQPVKPPSPEPVYHTEVSEGSLLLLSAFSNLSNLERQPVTQLSMDILLK